MKKISILVAILLLLPSCSHMSYRDKVIATTVSTAIIGGLVGSMTAPEDESRVAHSLMWGGVAGTSAAVTSLLYFEKPSFETQSKQVDALQQELSIYRGESSKRAGFETNLKSTGSAPLSGELPSEVKNLVQPGEWQLFELDQWVQQDDTTVIHQDKMFRLLPSTINIRGN